MHATGHLRIPKHASATNKVPAVLVMCAAALAVVLVVWPTFALALEVAVSLGAGGATSETTATSASSRALGGGSFLSEDGGTALAILARSGFWAFGLALLGTCSFYTHPASAR